MSYPPALICPNVYTKSEGLLSQTSPHHSASTGLMSAAPSELYGEFPKLPHSSAHKWENMNRQTTSLWDPATTHKPNCPRNLVLPDIFQCNILIQSFSSLGDDQDKHHVQGPIWSSVVVLEDGGSGSHFPGNQKTWPSLKIKTQQKIEQPTTSF